jgi:hypothetical protein
MANELAQTPAEVSDQPVTETTPTGSEAAPTQDRGDVQEALRQAREEARQYRAALNDPSVVFQAAQRLGMTIDPDQEAAPEPAPAPAPAATPTVQQKAPVPVTMEQMFDAMEYRDVAARQPDLFSDDASLRLLRSYKQDGLSWTQAADKVVASRKPAADAAAQADADAAKAQATTATPSTNVSSAQAQEVMALQNQLHQGTPSQRKDALMEILRRENAGMR